MKGVIVLTAILIKVACMIPDESHHISPRELQCVCSTEQCAERARTWCRTQHKCYTQLLDKQTGTVVRGCISGKTSLLCENFPPLVNESLVINWPYLQCCDDTEFCNSRPLDLSQTKMYRLQSTTASSPPEVKPAETEQVFEDEIRTEIFRPIVIIIVVVGLSIIAILFAIAYYILRNQRTTFSGRNVTNEEI